MLRNNRISTWRISTLLLLCLLGCLFILSVTTPGTWRGVARETTVGDLLGEMAASPQGDETVSLPLAPTVDLVDPQSVWTVAAASSALAARPMFSETANYQPKVVPLVFNLVGDSTDVADGGAEPAEAEPCRELEDNPSPLVALISETSPELTKELFAKETSPELTKEPFAEETSPELTKEPFAEETFEPDWPFPVALLEQLEKLAQSGATKTWATATRSLVESLIVALSSQTDQATGQAADQKASEIFDRLRVQGRQADRLAAQLDDDRLAEMLRRGGYSLRRRLDLWRLMSSIDSPPVADLSTTDAAKTDTIRLAMILDEVDAIMGDFDQSMAWREFLLIDALKGLAGEHESQTDGKADGENDVESKPLANARRRAIAGEVLSRVARWKLSESQRQFLSRESFVALGTELRRITDSSFDRKELVRRLELYEATNLPSDARGVAGESIRLSVSRDPRQRALGEQLDVNYCRANIRIALTEDILNLLMPKQVAELQPVHDTVLGKPVHGQSLTETDVAIRLIPDPHRLLLALEISGDVASITRSTSGPATFRNASSSRYVARKPMEITIAGINLWPAEVSQVRNVTRLQSVKTDFDGIPLIGSLVQGMARSSHDSRRREVNREIKHKVAARAKRRIDVEADARLNKTSKRLKTRLFEPLANLAITPEMIGAETTAERLVMQLRLASQSQLAAHTHRPWAPLDSLMSLQVHQTAVNNVLAGLKLNGATFTIAELKNHVGTKLNLLKVLNGDTKHDDVEITFARRDAARVDCQEGRIAVTLSIARLEKSPRVWKHFQVRAYYRVHLDGLSAKLVRDGSMRMVGRRVRTSSQVAIRSIFARVFSKNAKLQLVPDRIRNNPSMTDQVVTQFDIEDGWVAMALGPRR